MRTWIHAATAVALACPVLAQGATLVADPDTLALDAGGTQQMALSTEPPLAGALYLVLGSLSGTQPGVPLAGGLVLPLNPDVYLTHTLAHPGGPPLSGAFGTLDPGGTASAAFALAPGSDPALAGLALHHAFVALDPLLGGVAATSNAAPLALIASKTTWTVDDDGPADFAGVAEAIASPLVKPGDVLRVHPGSYASFGLDKPLRVVASAEGASFFAPSCTVHDVPEFTLAGLRTRALVIEDVPGRGEVDDCFVGEIFFDGKTGFYWIGRTDVRAAGELVVSRSTFHGDDACYPAAWDAEAAVTLEASYAVFVDSQIVGGFGAGDGCELHYPTAGAGLVALAGSTAILGGTSVSGGVGPFDTAEPAVHVDQSFVEVRGSSFHALNAGLPAAAVQGSGFALVSGVTVTGAPLPPWVGLPAEDAPYLRLEAGAAPAARLFGPAGAPALVVAADQPGFLPLAGLGVAWIDLSSVVAQGVAALLGQDAAVSFPLPPGLPAPGTTLIVQAYVAPSPAGLAYLTPPAQIAARD